MPQNSSGYDLGGRLCVVAGPLLTDVYFVLGLKLIVVNNETAMTIDHIWVSDDLGALGDQVDNLQYRFLLGHGKMHKKE